MAPRRRMLAIVQAAPWRSAATLGEMAGISAHHAGGLLSRMAAEGQIRQAHALPSDRSPVDGNAPRYVYGPLRPTADLPSDRLRAILTLLDLARDEVAAAIEWRESSRWAS
ncbi:MAG TPA: hypothetical protein VFV33_26275 [Gemmatimonadaceae bacterium]|nr:hypothetical protein [Gemmatimonadaceae bacterium]